MIEMNWRIETISNDSSRSSQVEIVLCIGPSRSRIVQAISVLNYFVKTLITRKELFIELPENLHFYPIDIHDCSTFNVSSYNSDIRIRIDLYSDTNYYFFCKRSLEKSYRWSKQNKYKSRWHRNFRQITHYSSLAQSNKSRQSFI